MDGIDMLPAPTWTWLNNNSHMAIFVTLWVLGTLLVGYGAHRYNERRNGRLFDANEDCSSTRK